MVDETITSKLLFFHGFATIPTVHLRFLLIYPLKSRITESNQKCIEFNSSVLQSKNFNFRVLLLFWRISTFSDFWNLPPKIEYIWAQSKCKKCICLREHETFRNYFKFLGYTILKGNLVIILSIFASFFMNFTNWSVKIHALENPSLPGKNLEKSFQLWLTKQLLQNYCFFVALQLFPPCIWDFC